MSRYGVGGVVGGGLLLWGASLRLIDCCGGCHCVVGQGAAEGGGFGGSPLLLA